MTCFGFVGFGIRNLLGFLSYQYVITLARINLVPRDVIFIEKESELIYPLVFRS